MNEFFNAIIVIIMCFICFVAGGVMTMRNDNEIVRKQFCQPLCSDKEVARVTVLNTMYVCSCERSVK